MNKMLSILAVISLLNLWFPVGSNAAVPMFEWGATTSETIDLLGSPVINPAGKTLGTINAFVNDSEGHVAFVILWQGVLEDFSAARYVAVPFSAISITLIGPAKVTVALNMEKGATDSAPSFDGINDLNNTESAARIYRYFGQTPQWTEEEAGKHVQP